LRKRETNRKLAGKERFLDDAWSTIDSLVREYAKNDKRTQEEKLLSLLKILDFLERSLGEEYYMLVQMKTLQYMTKQIRESYDVDLEDLKSTFEGIIQDEEKHGELLSKIKKILAPKENKAKDNTPEVRYTNPDAWTRPLPDSVYENAR
jgi:rubrerythrin